MTPLTNPEIDSLEQELGCTLPGLYRKLLVEQGYGTFGEAEVYHPAEVRKLYESFFDDPAQLFHPYFPFGCQNYKQELWVIDAAAERAASIWHETVTDDWPDEEWLEYDEWVSVHLDTEIPGTD